MAPFKSSLGRSLGKFLKVSNNNDLSLRGAVQSIRKLPPFTASGGTITTPGNGYVYHFFTNSVSPEPFNVTDAPSPKDIDVLVIGGGGAGGGRTSGGRSGGGGGGAGGFVESTSIPISIGSYTVTVGAGGAAYPSASSAEPLNNRFSGSNGEYSEIALPTPVRAEGGGGGGGFNTPAGGNPGGSGGGGGEGPVGPYSFGTADRVVGTSTPATPGQGYPGGSGGLYSPGAGGGGGGAGGAGTDGVPTNVAGLGGIGRAAFSGDTGIPPSYGTPGPTAGRWFAGGGGGADYSETNPVGTGGAGGGGDGFASGTTNTGGGGGAQNNGPLVCSGGPGIVIVRYLKDT